jgi:hypothetical protein
MKKVLIFVVVLVLAAVLIGPKIVSVQLANGIQNAVNAVNKNPAYTASVISIQSGWFNTQALVTVGMDIPDMSGMTGQSPPVFSVNIEVTGSHGPFIINDGFAIGWLRSVVQTQSSELPAGLVLSNAENLYKFEGLTGIFGTTTYQDAIAALTYIDPETQGKVNFTGLQGKGELSNSKVMYNAVSRGLSMNVENILNFDIQGLALSIESGESIATMMSQGLYDSNSRISASTMIFDDLSKGTQVRVTDTELEGLTRYDKSSDLGGITITSKVAQIDATKMQLSDLLSVIEINNIQANFLLAYQDFSNKMIENISNPEQVQIDLDTFISTYLLDQLTAKPEYNFSNISGKINDSEFSGNILVSIAELTQLPRSLEDTAFWMQNAVVTSAMLIEKNAAEFIAATMMARQLSMNPNFAALSEQEQAAIISQQVQGTLEGLVQQGMVTREGENYRIAFSLQEGVAMLNDNQIPLG